MSEKCNRELGDFYFSVLLKWQTWVISRTTIANPTRQGNRNGNISWVSKFRKIPNQSHKHETKGLTYNLIFMRLPPLVLASNIERRCFAACPSPRQSPANSCSDSPPRDALSSLIVARPRPLADLLPSGLPFPLPTLRRPVPDSPPPVPPTLRSSNDQPTFRFRPPAFARFPPLARVSLSQGVPPSDAGEIAESPRAKPPLHRSSANHQGLIHHPFLRNNCKL